MIKQIPTLFVIIGIAVIILGFNLVMNYGLSFYSGIALFFGIAMLVAGVDLKRKTKKMKTKNKKEHHEYTISKLMEEEDKTKEDSKDNL